MRKYTLPPTNPYAPSTHTNVHPVLTPQWADRTDDFDVATAVLRCLHPNTPSTTPTTTPVSSPERPRMAPDPRAAEEQEDISEAEEEGGAGSRAKPLCEHLQNWKEPPPLSALT